MKQKPLNIITKSATLIVLVTVIVACKGHSADREDNMNKEQEAHFKIFCAEAAKRLHVPEADLKIHHQKHVKLLPAEFYTALIDSKKLSEHNIHYTDTDKIKLEGAVIGKKVITKHTPNSFEKLAVAIQIFQMEEVDARSLAFAYEYVTGGFGNEAALIQDNSPVINLLPPEQSEKISGPVLHRNKEKITLEFWLYYGRQNSVSHYTLVIGPNNTVNKTID